MEMNELDRLLAEKVMGWVDSAPGCDMKKHRQWKDSGGNFVMRVYHWHPTRDIAQAFMVAEKVDANEIEITMGSYFREAERWSCKIVERDSDERHWGQAATPALAISLAAKAWLEKESK